jgi:hypothetical protein
MWSRAIKHPVRWGYSVFTLIVDIEFVVILRQAFRLAS